MVPVTDKHKAEVALPSLEKPSPKIPEEHFPSPSRLKHKAVATGARCDSFATPKAF